MQNSTQRITSWRRACQAACDIKVYEVGAMENNRLDRARHLILSQSSVVMFIVRSTIAPLASGSRSGAQSCNLWHAHLQNSESLRPPLAAAGRLSRRSGRQPPSLVTASHGSELAISFQPRRRFLRCRRTISSRQRFGLFSQNHQLTAA